MTAMTTPTTQLAEIAERLGKLPYKEYRHSPEEAGQVEGHYVDPCDGEERWLHAASFSGCVDEWAGNSEFFVQATKDIPYLLAQLTAAQARSREDAELMKTVSIYLTDLENNMLRNNVDMRLDPCEAPSDIADNLRARADELEGRT